MLQVHSRICEGNIRYNMYYTLYYILFIYYMDKSVLVENRPLIKFI